MLNTADLDLAGLSVHFDPIPIFYKFTGILAFIKINDGWNFHHGAGNTGTGIDFGKHPPFGRCAGHERRAEITRPTVRALAARQQLRFGWRYGRRAMRGI